MVKKPEMTNCPATGYFFIKFRSIKFGKINNMAFHSRRHFINTVTMAAPVALTATGFTTFASKEMFIHHVYFWLKNPGNKDDRARLVEGLKKLSKVSTIRMHHIGQPAATNRDVIDTTYAISWLVLFDDKAGQDSYQTDPIHLKFVEECSSLWSKVIVYDSIDV